MVGRKTQHPVNCANRSAETTPRYSVSDGEKEIQKMKYTQKPKSTGSRPGRSPVSIQSHGEQVLVSGLHRASQSSHPRQTVFPALPLTIHQDDIVHGRIDFAAVRRREDAERKRLIAASQKPCPPATMCDHERAVKFHVFADGRVLKLYGCGCSNGAEILNGRKTHGEQWGRTEKKEGNKEEADRCQEAINDLQGRR
jgi:hypothetical protein